MKGAWVVLIFSPLAVLGAVPGDECVAPIDVTVPASGYLSVKGSTVSATTSSLGFGDESCVSDGNFCNDVWYRTQSLSAGTVVTIATGFYYPATASFDTIIGVYASCGAAAVACNDDGSPIAEGNHLSTVTMVVETDGPLLIRVAGYTDGECSSGTFDLMVALGNGYGDTCTNPIELTIPGTPSDGMLVVSGDISVFSPNTQIHFSCIQGGLPCYDVWFQTQSLPAGTQITVATAHAPPGALAMYAGCVDPLEFACTSVQVGGQTIVTGVVATTGPVLIRLATWCVEVPSSMYDFSLAIGLGGAPPGDECADPIAIKILGKPSAGQLIVSGDTALYTTSPTTISCADSDICADVWYKTQSLPAGTRIMAATLSEQYGVSSSFDTELAFYTACGEQFEFGCNEDISVTNEVFQSMLEAVVPTTGPVFIRLSGWASEGSCSAGQYQMLLKLGDGCESVCGDPHFRGLDGVKYEFKGEPNKVFAIVSDPAVQINAMFKAAPRHKTFLGATCVRTCNHTVVLTPGEAGVSLDGATVKPGQRFSSPQLQVYRPHKHTVEVSIPGRWRFSFEVGVHVDINHATPLFHWDNKTHGVLGHTLRGKHETDTSKCNPKSQGGCEVEGHFRDYEVAGNLCSTVWKHSMFGDCA